MFFLYGENDTKSATLAKQLSDVLVRGVSDKRFKETGHVNAYFPMLIPESLLMKEADDVEGLAPQVAWVTQGGNEVL